MTPSLVRLARHRANHLVGALQVNLERFLDQHVLAGLGRGDGDFGVVSGWVENAHYVHCIVVQQPSPVGVVSRHPVFSCEVPDLGLIAGTPRGDELAPLDERQLFGVRPPRHPGTDQPKTDLAVFGHVLAAGARAM